MKKAITAIALSFHYVHVAQDARLVYFIKNLNRIIFDDKSTIL